MAINTASSGRNLTRMFDMFPSTNPSDQLRDIISGKVAWADASPSIQSWARFHVYQEAVKILSITGQEKRRIELDKLPAHIRPMVEAEALRVWNWRRMQKTA